METPQRAVVKKETTSIVFLKLAMIAWKTMNMGCKELKLVRKERALRENSKVCLNGFVR
jgi:hypothetical protein